MKPGFKQTEVGVIPTDWKAVRLEDIADIDVDNLPSSTPHDFSFNYIALEDVELGCLRGFSEEIFGDAPSRARRVIRHHDILVSTVRPNLKSHLLFAHEHGNWICSTGFSVVRCKKGMAAPRLIFQQFFAEIVSRQIDALLTGSNYPAINRNDVSGLCMPIPPTLAEQEAIAEALGDADALIESLERLIAKKRDVKQGAMQELLTARRRLPGFTGKWDRVEFGSVATIRNEKAFASSMPAETPCVELESIGPGTGRLITLLQASGSSSKYKFMKGDVLFGRLRAYLKKYWYATFCGVCSTEIWPLIPRSERLRSEYLHLIVQTNEFADAAGVSYGTHMPRSDWSILRKHGIQLPQVNEQAAIATVLSDMDAEITALEEKLGKARAIKQGMMQELLTGRIRLV